MTVPASITFCQSIAELKTKADEVEDALVDMVDEAEAVAADLADVSVDGEIVVDMEDET